MFGEVTLLSPLPVAPCVEGPFRDRMLLTAAVCSIRLASVREQLEKERRSTESAKAAGAEQAAVANARALKELHSQHQRELEELRLHCNRKLEEAEQQYTLDKGTAEAAWAVAKAETQQQWMNAMQALQQRSADQLATQLAKSSQVTASFGCCLLSCC